MDTHETNDLQRRRDRLVRNRAAFIRWQRVPFSLTITSERRYRNAARAAVHRLRIVMRNGKARRRART
jgi:hypothetical protein